MHEDFSSQSELALSMFLEQEDDDYVSWDGALGT